LFAREEDHPAMIPLLIGDARDESIKQAGIQAPRAPDAGIQFGSIVC
jgi:hypothetical protein